MSNSRHQRSESSESNSSHGSHGSAYQLILDHVFSYPGSYDELPLRSLYTLNSAPRAQPLHSGNHSPSSEGSPPTTPQGPFRDNQATQTLTDNLMAQMSKRSNQPTSLPPSFITSFVRRCFPPELVRVDFPQALTGLDYLKDLETRRRREVAAAMKRLNIDRDMLDSNEDLLFSRYPGLAQWTQLIEEKERKIEALYTQLYVGLRRWILINELSLLPFNKHNCVAMLNTLYPPVISTPPTSKLTPQILKNQREGFFKYILSVEKSGSRILGTLMQQGKAAGDDNGWVAVTRTLGMYLQLANSMIQECVEVTDVQSVSQRKDRDSKSSSRDMKSAHSDSKGAREPRKVDSGVSFNVSEGASSRSNSISETASPNDTASHELPRPETARPETARPATAMRDPQRPKTPAGSVMSTATTRPRAPSARNGTALERIARGLKTIGRGRPEVTEIIPDSAPSPPPEKSKALRKMKSLGNIDAHNGSKGDLTSMSLKSQQRQAGVVSAQKTGMRQSHDI